MKLEDLDIGENQWEDSRMCDGCEYQFSGEDYGVVYFCDCLWYQGEEVNLPNPVSEELYCLNCFNNEVPLPHLGTNEGFYLVLMESHPDNGDLAYEKIELVQGSPAKEGVDWKPLELIDQYSPTPIEMVNYAITPAHVFNIFYRQGVDLRGFVEEGEIQIPDSISNHLEQLTRVTLQHRRDLWITPDHLDEL